MEPQLPTIEALAHYMRGATTLFFLFWCVKIYYYRKRNRMMRLLFFATIFLTFSYLKDGIFIISAWKNSIYLDNIVKIFDLLLVPLVSAFFIEATKPGLPTHKQLFFGLGIQASFIPIYMFFPDEIVFFCAFSLTMAMVITTTTFVLLFSYKHHKYITSNYSYYENIDVSWVTISSLVYFISLFFYYIAFDSTTWLSEALFNVFSICLWTFLIIYARRHRVIKLINRNDIMKKNKNLKETEGSEHEEHFETPNSEINTAEGNQEGIDDPVSERRYKVLGEKLRIKMEEDKVFLNPKLTLGDLASTILTNKTYLSEYINNILKTTFYDYVNSYRIHEACRIIDSMPTEGRKSMATVAEMSGFCSLATFNRYFVKIKGVSPKNYYKPILENAIKATESDDSLPSE